MWETFTDFDICHCMVSLQKLCSVIYDLKVQIFKIFKIFNISEMVRASTKNAQNDLYRFGYLSKNDAIAKASLNDRHLISVKVWTFNMLETASESQCNICNDVAYLAFFSNILAFLSANEFLLQICLHLYGTRHRVAYVYICDSHQNMTSANEFKITRTYIDNSIAKSEILEIS